MQQNIKMGVHHVDLTSPIPTESPLLNDTKNNNKSVDLEREEGEIIEDEYEDIISSDEEFSMRKRIEELESRNAELEKIANISGIYNYELSSKKDVSHENDRNALATIDLSDLDDYPTPNKSSNQQLQSSISFANNKQNYSHHLQKSTIKSSISYPKRETHRGHIQYSRYDISENYNFIPSRRNSSNRSRRQSSSPELISSSVSPVPKARIKKQQRNTRSGGGGKSKNRKNKTLNKTVQSTKKSIVPVYDDLSSSEDDEFCALNRNELRLALKRDTSTTIVPNRGNFKNSVSLDKKLFPPIENSKTMPHKEKHENQSLTNNCQILPDETIEVEKNVNDAHISSDDSVSLEEQELRLIALKSAVVKKHLARKKRKENEEKKPYSPSDFDNIKITPSPNNYDTIGTGNSMDISPIASPELLLSDNDENTKPIDMDLVNSSDSDEPVFVGQHWMPIQEIPLPKELNEIKPPGPSNIIHSPQPRKLINNEETKEFINSLNDSNLIVQNNNNTKYPESMDIINNDDNTKIIISSLSSPEQTDEEELALRTLLLSKMNINSPKVNKNNLVLRNSIEYNNPNTAFLQIDNSSCSNTIHSNQINENIGCGDNEFNVVENEVDALRNLILNTMRPNNKTASVLKEAVRRLKNSSNDQVPNDVPSFNDYLQEPYQEEQYTNSIPENINLENYNLPQIIDPSYLINIENSNYETANIQQQQIYFEHNNFQLMPNFIPKMSMQNNNPSPDNRDPIRPALKVIPIKELSKCREKIINNLKNPKLNDNLIKVQLKNVSPIISQSSNLKEILLTTTKSNSAVRFEENDISKLNLNDNNQQFLSQDVIKKNQENIVEELNLPIQNNIIVENICQQSEQSLEISRKIESLKKLSNSIQQTTEISIKSKIPLARKSAPQILIKNPAAVMKKIVNANRVINQSTVLKRKVVPTNQQQQNDIAMKRSRITLSQTTTTNQIKASNSSSNLSRLITNIEIPQVKKMIINLGNSSATEDSEEDEFFEIGNQSTTIENKYNDNASPMSVQMDSPYYSPNTSSYNSPCPSVIPCDKLQNTNEEVRDVEEDVNCGDGNDKDETMENLKENKSNEMVVVGKSVENDVFQAKLDEFLKNARTKVESVKKIVYTPVVDDANVPVSQLNPVTPLSVRHLPESSQMEYRRLVSRMKILEKQKQAKKSTDLPSLTNFQVTITNDKAASLLANQTNIENSTLTNQSLLNIKKTIINDMAAVSKLQDDSLIRKVLIKNTTTKPITKPATTSTTTTTATTVNDPKNTPSTSNLSNDQNIKTRKTDLLQRYETAYHKNGCHILEHINKALILVNQGKEAKCKKLLIQERMIELNKQMEKCKNDIKIQADKIGKIYPDIINFHKIIGNFRCRRTKLQKVTTNLGKSLNGDVYCLEDINNQEISDKSKSLSVEIKILKNLKLDDIKNENTTTNLNNDIININSIDNDNNQENKTDDNNIEKCKNDNNKIDFMENVIDKVDNNIDKQNIENAIENPPKNNTENTEESNNLNIEECAIKLSSDIVLNLDNNNKVVSPIENDNNNTENNDVVVDDENCKYVVDEEAEKSTCQEAEKSACPENLAENIPVEVLFEKNISNLQTVLNQKDVPPIKGFHYTSPLDYKKDERQLNPNDIICPYQLMGQCDDKDCKYGHLFNNIGTSKTDDDDAPT